MNFILSHGELGVNKQIKTPKNVDVPSALIKV